METHDRYDRDILKALQSIAKSLDKIERHISAIEITSAYDSDPVKEYLNRIVNGGDTYPSDVNTPGTDA